MISKTISLSSLLLTSLLLQISPSTAHRGGRYSAPPPKVPDAETDWATMHLAEEHHLDNFDAGAFFALHDYDSSGRWTPQEVRRTYGLEDESTKDVSAEKREEVTREVFRLFDEDRNGVIEREEWMRLSEKGVRLPDFGLGPGHHGDDEYEYEIHHFEKFHGENAKEEDLTHPEDIAHFAKHDREDEENERIALQNQKPIIEANIPQMFRRKSVQ